MITVIGIFDDPQLAEDAALYLEANDFIEENIDVHTSGNNTNEHGRVGDFFSHLLDDEKEAAHYATIGRQGTIVTVHAVSTREAQEAIDVFNTYGAIDVNAMNSKVIERIVDADKRLRGPR